MDVIENIKNIRIEKGIAQKVLADYLCVDVSAVSNMENGKRDLKVSELAKIAKALEVRVIDLFTWPDKYVLAASDDSLDAVLQIRLKNSTKDEVLRMVLGEQNLELLKRDNCNSVEFCKPNEDR